MHVAAGDHQVADFTTSIMARTFGARIRQPALAAGPHALLEPVVRRCAACRRFPYDGSAVVWWDAGIPLPPLENKPNRAGEDPHGAPRSEVAARQQKSEFLKVDGRVVEVCGGGPCYARGYTGRAAWPQHPLGRMRAA